MTASGHLALLLQLLDTARPAAHFPDARRVKEWLALLSRPWTGRTTPKVELHPVSGFPTRRSLEQLLERQRVAREFFAAHRAQPPKSSDQLNVALAAAELWSPGTHARVMAAQKARSRLLLTHDRFDEKAGTLIRFSVQLEQQGARHVKLHGETACACTSAFERAVEQACDGDATTAGLRLAALEGLTVHEVVRGELGPFASAHAGAFTPVPARGDEGVLSLGLERVGSTVSRDHLADAWPPPDEHAERRGKLGWRRSRDRKLVCTAGLRAELERVATGSRMLVRSR